MNKIAILALATFLVVGISYQAKRSYDAHHTGTDAGHDAASNQTTGGLSPNDGHSTSESAANGKDASGLPTTATTQNSMSPDAASNSQATNENHVGTSTGITDGANQATSGTNGNSGNSAHKNNSETAMNAGDTHTANGNHDVKSSGSVGKNAAGTNSANNAANGKPNAANDSATTGSTATGSTGTTQATEKVAKVVPEKPKDNCFSFEYRHKKEAANQDIENFLDHTNAFPLAHGDYNPKSLCVKVNDKAVTYQVSKYKQTPEVRVGSVVGPESVIRVSYCVGKVNPCREKCEQPKKRFMDDLMSEASDDDSFNDSWGKGDTEKAKKDLKNKAKELRTIASENDHLNDGSIQRDWDQLQKQETYCK